MEYSLILLLMCNAISFNELNNDVNNVLQKIITEMIFPEVRTRSLCRSILYKYI